MDEAIEHYHYFKGGYNELAYISLIHGGPQKYLWWQLHHQLSPVSLSVQFSSIQFSCSVVSDSLRPHESQHARPPCPSPTPGVH